MQCRSNLILSNIKISFRFQDKMALQKSAKITKYESLHIKRPSNSPLESKKLSSYLTGSLPKSYNEKPTPRNFDTFFPWFCLQMEIPESVTVIRMAQEIYPSTKRLSSAKEKISKTKSIRFEGDTVDSQKKAAIASHSLGTQTNDHGLPENAICVKAFYDSRGHLVEICITDCPNSFHRKVIQVINVCLPFHTQLTKLCIFKSKLTRDIIYEIGKLLPHSNLTDVVLDGTYVPEGNFYILLECISNLKHLSLSRCKINDEVCEKITRRLSHGQPAEKSLRILNLSSNSVSDEGVKFIGETLRSNRNLLHLNLADNKITDSGLFFILSSLMEFPLTFEELLTSKRKKLKYTQNLLLVQEHCLQKIVTQTTENEKMNSKRLSSPKTKLVKKSKKQLFTEDLLLQNVEIAKLMAKDILGEFKDPFDDNSTLKRQGYRYSIGNLTLCSLNLAYNNLELPSLEKILEVLRYQSLTEKVPPDTGIMRLVLDGNYIPHNCSELEEISLFLKNVVRVKSSTLVKSSTILLKSRSGSRTNRASSSVTRHS